MVNIMELLLYLVCGWICYALAKKKNRNKIGWTICGIFFNIFSIIILAFLPKIEIGTEVKAKEVKPTINFDKSCITEKANKFKELLIKKDRMAICLVISLVFNTIFFFSINGLGNKIDEQAIRIEEIKKDRTRIKEEREELKKEKVELEEKIEELEGKVEEAKPWFEMKEEERKAEQERLQKEKEEKEKAEQEEKERQEKIGYDTGITYSQLARTPDDYKGQKVKFSGKVLQVQEGLFSDVIRLGVNGSYDNVLWLSIPITATKSDERILEDDYITIYGVADGIKTYETVLGASISIPSVTVDKLER